MEFISEYPSWLVLVCLAAGLAYSLGLYVRDRLNRHFSKWLIYLLGAMRFVTVTILALFLLKPLLKSVERTEEKPIIVIAQDVSESIVLNKDSSFYKGQYMEELATHVTALSENYDVRTYQFDAEVREGLENVDFTGKSTNYSILLDDLYSRFSNRNLGAVIIASDGLYNKGSNPIYAGSQLDVPFFTIAMGDSAQRRDLVIADIAHNRLAYLGNNFPIEILVQANQVDGESSRIRIVKRGSTLFNQEISFEGNSFEQIIPITLEAKETGLQKYTVIFEEIENEVTGSNNQMEFYIDVLDSRQKILLLSSAPHPDLGAIHQAINSNENYEVRSMMAEDFSENIQEYSLVIFHQLPDLDPATLPLVKDALDHDIPSLFVLGAGTNFNSFNRLNTGYKLERYKGTLNEVHGSMNEDFTLFKLDDQSAEIVRNLPPLHMPFGDFSHTAGVVSLFTQRIGLIETDAPLLSFNKEGSVKIGLIAGEGLWRWRLVSYLESGNHEAFDKILSKTIQYLASKEDKSFFRVTGETDLLENESIVFEAELYNESYDLTNDPEISMKISDDEENQYSYTFSRRGLSYRLDAGRLPVGNYSYEARTSVGGLPQVEKGEFSISSVQLELTSSRANHQLLYQFAVGSGGQMISDRELHKLPELLAAMEELKTISHESKMLSDLINTKWILFLILGLICLEWLLRKRSGTY